MTPSIRRIVSVATVWTLLVFSAAAARADVVLQWNEIAARTFTTQTPALNPFATARFAAIVQLAVFEAVNTITGDYQGYLGSEAAPTGLPISAPGGSSAEAAAIQAAYRVLFTYFGGNAATAAALNADLAASLALIPNGASKTNGIATGQAAALALIALRAIDGSSPLSNYLPTPLHPGDWDIYPGCPTSAGGAQLGGILANWGDVRPFGIALPATGHWYEPFRPVPPPELSSNEYAKDYNEVKTVGSALATPQQRPADRALVVRFFGSLSPTYLFHQASRQIATARGDSLSENARNLALVSIATNDALVASFKTKYFYKFWRPITAIHLGATDGNGKTTEDAAWTTFWQTPCFPSYPSNHASGSGAALEAMRRIYGAAGHDIALTATVAVIAPTPTTLHYTQLQKIADDIDDARVYGGIHFRFDQTAGSRLGREIATYVYKNNLQPVHP
jgi:hypothetical protein